MMLYIQCPFEHQGMDHNKPRATLDTWWVSIIVKPDGMTADKHEMQALKPNPTLGEISLKHTSKIAWQG